MRRNTFMANLEAYKNKNESPAGAVATMETIAQQKNDPFGPALEAIVAKYEDMCRSGASHRVISAAKDLKKELETLVFNRLGIRIELVTDNYLAATIPNIYIPHNAMIREDMRGLYAYLEEVGGQAELRQRKHLESLGTVNTETARVSGWFSEQVVPLFANFRDLFLDLDMTVPQVTAIILHELGHDFNGILFSSAINTTNQIIADIVKHISESDRGGDINYVYAKARSIDPKIGKDVAEGLVSGNKVVMNIAAYRLVVGAGTSLLDNSHYDDTGYEAVSDNFATKFGYGLHLVTGLERLERDYPEYERTVSMFTAAMQVAAVFGFIGICSLIASVAINIFFLPLGLLLTLFSFLILTSNRASMKDLTYDNIRDRYMRIRNQLVSFIKDPKINTATRKCLLVQIDTIDEIIKKKKVFVSVIERVSPFIFKSDARSVASILQQQDIEKMLANDIFVAANRLALKE